MKSTQDHLRANQRRRNLIEGAHIGALCAALVGIGIAAFIYIGPESSHGWPIKAAASAFFALFAGFPILHLLKWTSTWLCDRFAPEWVLEAGDGVIKVHGAVPIMQWRKVEAQMLAMRPGYMPAPDAAATYKCTMAAIPASTGYLVAKRELAALGVR